MHRPKRIKLPPPDDDSMGVVLYSRAHAGVAVDQVKEEIYSFGGRCITDSFTGDELSNDLWVLPKNGKWQRVRTRGRAPSRRSHCGSVMDSNGWFWVTGGRDGEGNILHDIHRCNIMGTSTREFECVWEIFQLPQPIPPMMGHSVTCKFGQLVLLGGVLKGYEPNTSIYTISTQTCTFESSVPLAIEDIPESLIVHHSGRPCFFSSKIEILHENFVIVYAGRSLLSDSTAPDNAVLNRDVFVLCLSSMKWGLLKQTCENDGNKEMVRDCNWFYMFYSPHSRTHDALLWKVLTPQKVFYTGVDEEQLLNNSLTWIENTPEGTPTGVAMLPVPRTGGVTECIGEGLIVAGGVSSDDTVLSDLWKMTLFSEKWTQLVAFTDQKKEPAPPLIQPHPPGSPMSNYFTSEGNTTLSVDGMNKINVARANRLWSPPGPNHNNAKNSTINVLLKPDAPANFRKDIRVLFDMAESSKTPPDCSVCSKLTGTHPIESNISLKNITGSGTVLSVVELATDVSRFTTDIVFIEAVKRFKVCIRLTATLGEAAKRRQYERKLAFEESEKRRAAEVALLHQHDEARERAMQLYGQQEDERIRVRCKEADEMEQIRRNEHKRQRDAEEFERMKREFEAERQLERDREEKMEQLRKKEIETMRNREKEKESLIRDQEVKLKRLCIAEEELNTGRAQLERERLMITRERDQNLRERQWEKAKDEEWEKERAKLSRKTELQQQTIEKLTADAKTLSQDVTDLKVELAEWKKKAQACQLKLDFYDGRGDTEVDAEWTARRDIRNKELKLAKMGNFEQGSLKLHIKPVAVENIQYFIQGTTTPVLLSSITKFSVEANGKPDTKTTVRSATLAVEVKNGLSKGDALSFINTETDDDTRTITTCGGTTVYGTLEKSPENKIKVVLKGENVGAAVQSCEMLISRLGFYTPSKVTTLGIRTISITVTINNTIVTASRLLEVIAPILTLKDQERQIVYVEGKGSLAILPNVSFHGLDSVALHTRQSVMQCMVCSTVLKEGFDTEGGPKNVFVPIEGEKIAAGGGFLTFRVLKGWSDDDYMLLEEGYEVNESTLTITKNDEPDTILGYLRSGKLGNVVAPQSQCLIHTALRNNNEATSARFMLVLQLPDDADWGKTEALARVLCFRNDSLNPTRPRRLLSMSHCVAPTVSQDVAAPGASQQQQRQIAKRNAKKKEWEKEYSSMCIVTTMGLEVLVINVDEPTEIHVVSSHLGYSFPYEAGDDLSSILDPPTLQVCKGVKVIDEDTDEFHEGSLKLFMDCLSEGDTIDLDKTLSKTIDFDTVNKTVKYNGKDVATYTKCHGEISIVFTGYVAYIDAVENLLQTVVFYCDPTMPCVPGLRGFVIELIVGEAEVLCKKININVSPPRLSLPPTIQCLEFREGSVPLALGVFQIQTEVFPVSLISFRIAKGSESADCLGLRNAKGPTESVQWPTGFSKSQLPSTAMAIAQKVYLLTSEQQDTLHLYISSPLPCETVKSILRRVTYVHKSKNPRKLDKLVLISVLELTCPTITTESFTQSKITVQPLDDATELKNYASTTEVNLGSVSDLRGCLILPSVVVYDPDTDDFRDGYITVECCKSSVVFDVCPIRTQQSLYTDTSIHPMMDASDSFEQGECVPQPRQKAVIHRDGAGVWLHDNILSYETWRESHCNTAAHLGSFVSTASEMHSGKKPCESSVCFIQLSSKGTVSLNGVATLLRNITIRPPSPGKYPLTVSCNAGDAPDCNAASISFVMEFNPQVFSPSGIVVESKPDSRCLPASGVVVTGLNLKEVISNKGCLQAVVESPETGETVALATKDTTPSSPLAMQEEGIWHGKCYIGGYRSVLGGFVLQFDDKSSKVDVKTLTAVLKNIEYTIEKKKNRGDLSRVTVVIHETPSAANYYKTHAVDIAVVQMSTTLFSTKNLTEYVHGSMPVQLFPGFTFTAELPLANSVIEIRNLGYPYYNPTDQLFLDDAMASSDSIADITQSALGYKITFTENVTKQVVYSAIRSARYSCNTIGKHAVEILLTVHSGETTTLYSRVYWSVVTPALLSLWKCNGKIQPCKAAGKGVDIAPLAVIDVGSSRRKSLKNAIFSAELATLDVHQALRRCVGGQREDLQTTPGDTLQFSKAVTISKADEVSIGGAVIGKAHSKSSSHMVIMLESRKDTATPQAVQVLIRSLQFCSAKPGSEAAVRISLQDGKDGPINGGVFLVTAKQQQQLTPPLDLKFVL